MALSMTAEEIIEKARECYSLGLITEQMLEHVTTQAERDPSYDAILDLPLDYEVEHERELRRQAARKDEPPGLLHRLFRR